MRGAMGWARDHPDTDLILVGDEAQISPFLEGALPAHISLVQATESVGMDEHPAQAVRRKRDASINVCMRLVREGRADAVVTAGHTGAGGGVGHPAPGPPAGRRSAGAGRAGGLRARPVRPARHRRDDRLDGPQPLPVRADGHDLRRAGARRGPAVRGAAVDRRGGRQGRGRASRRRPSAARERPQLRGQRRGQGPHDPPGRRGRVRRERRQRHHQVLRGPQPLHLRPAHDRVQAAALGAHRLRLHAPGHRPHPAPASTTSSWAARRCWGSRAPCW